MIASDITAIINRTKRYIILDDNEVAIVRPDSVVVMNEFGDTVEKEIMTVTWDMSAAEKGGYQHFMLKEIMEQLPIRLSRVSKTMRLYSRTTV